MKSCYYRGGEVNNYNQIVGNIFDSNGSSAYAGSLGFYLNGGANVIDSNTFKSNGGSASLANGSTISAANIVIRNIFTTLSYSLTRNNTVGPYVDMSSTDGTITNTSPWANFYY